jgi:hypothetical protein
MPIFESLVIGGVPGSVDEPGVDGAPGVMLDPGVLVSVPLPAERPGVTSVGAVRGEAGGLRSEELSLLLLTRSLRSVQPIATPATSASMQKPEITVLIVVLRWHLRFTIRARRPRASARAPQYHLEPATAVPVDRAVRRPSTCWNLAAVRHVPSNTGGAHQATLAE